VFKFGDDFILFLDVPVMQISPQSIDGKNDLELFQV